MSLEFSDQFTRGDGAVGADWTVDSGTWVIASNRLQSSVAGRIRCNTQPTGPNVCAAITVAAYVAATRTYGIRLRQNAAGTSYVYAQLAVGATTLIVTLSTYVGGALIATSSRTVEKDTSAAMSFRVSAVGALIWCWVDSYLLLAGTNDDVAANGAVVLTTFTSNQYVDDFWLYSLGENAGLITVNESSGGAPTYDITIYNTGPVWTPGTPGSPTFEAKTGTITSQVVVDEDTATLVWVAPSIVSFEQIRDTGFENYYNFTLTNPAGASGVAGSGSGLTTLEHEILLKLDTEVSDYLTEAVTYSDPWAVLMGAAWWILGHDLTGQTYNFGDLVAAILADDGKLAVIDAQSYSAMSLVSNMTSAGTWTLQNVWQYVQGSGAHTIADVLDALAALGTPTASDLTEILAELASIRTANLWTLGHVKDWIDAIPEADVSSVMQELAYIRTANLWTLGHVKDWIDAIPSHDYSSALDSIANAVDAIPTNPVTSLQSVLDAIAAVRGSGSPDIRAVLTAIAGLPTNPITSLQPVLDAVSTLSTLLNTKATAILAAIDALTPTPPTPTAPVWPGLANVTLGTPVNIGLTFASSEACDGVIVSITGDPLMRSSYDWGGLIQHPRAGYIAFVTDDGQYSDQQPFTFPSHLICPTAMLHPDGFIGKARAGVSGTVTPWTINVA